MKKILGLTLALTTMAFAGAAKADYVDNNRVSRQADAILDSARTAQRYARRPNYDLDRLIDNTRDLREMAYCNERDFCRERKAVKNVINAFKQARQTAQYNGDDRGNEWTNMSAMLDELRGEFDLVRGWNNYCDR